MTSKREQLISKQAQKKGLRGKVNAHCISCVYDEKSGLGTWRQQVGLCSVTGCPLYSVRPMPQEATTTELKSEV